MSRRTSRLSETAQTGAEKNTSRNEVKQMSRKNSENGFNVSLTLKIVMTAAVLLGGTAFLGNVLNNGSYTNKDSLLSESSQSSKAESQTSSKTSELPKAESQTSEEASVTVTYTMADIARLNNTDYFAKGTLEHIFDGTINKKGNATGYHYTMVSDSKGEIIEGTRSSSDKNGVFTAKVKVSGKKKNGFSSFYPESWTPQQVVDAINTAYEEAVSDPLNSSGSLWIGHSGNIEIDMYLDSSRKITTAYPVYEGS